MHENKNSKQPTTVGTSAVDTLSSYKYPVVGVQKYFKWNLHDETQNRPTPHEKETKQTQACTVLGAFTNLKEIEKFNVFLLQWRSVATRWRYWEVNFLCL